MTNKLVTAYIDNDFDPFSSKQYVEEFFGGYFKLEGIARVKGRSPSGLEVEPEYGFEDTEAQVQVVTVQYTVTEEYAVSLTPELEEESIDPVSGSDQLEQDRGPEGSGGVEQTHL